MGWVDLGMATDPREPPRRPLVGCKGCGSEQLYGAGYCSTCYSRRRNRLPLDGRAVCEDCLQPFQIGPGTGRTVCASCRAIRGLTVKAARKGATT